MFYNYLAAYTKKLNIKAVLRREPENVNKRENLFHAAVLQLLHLVSL